MRTVMKIEVEESHAERERLRGLKRTRKKKNVEEPKPRLKPTDPDRMRYDLSRCGVCSIAVLYKNRKSGFNRTAVTEYYDEPGVLHAHQPGEAMKDVLVAVDWATQPPYMGRRGEGQ